MNEQQTTTPQPQQPAKQSKPPASSPGDRTPTPIDKLLVTHSNPHGVKVPDGIEGKGEKLKHSVFAGIEGDVKTEIEHRPWMRVFRITKSRRVTRTDKGREVETWERMGKPFHMPDTWAVSVPADE